VVIQNPQASRNPPSLSLSLCSRVLVIKVCVID
jgi:hypothetical protein